MQDRRRQLYMKNMQKCTVQIIYTGALLIAVLVTLALLFILAAGNIIDPLVGDNYIDEFLLAAEKIAVMTMLCAFISDFITGRKN